LDAIISVVFFTSEKEFKEEEGSFFGFGCEGNRASLKRRPV
jgi:hypothetical protein